MSERVPVGTHVLYNGVPHVVRGYDDPAEHPDERVREVAAEEYEDGTGYFLWPADVPYKLGNRDRATSWVRRKSFEVTEPGEKVSPDTSGGPAEREVRVTVFAPAHLTLTEIAEMFWDKLDRPDSVLTVDAVAVTSSPLGDPAGLLIRTRKDRA